MAIDVDSPLVLGNRLTLLEDGPASCRAMFAAMRAAKDHIHLEPAFLKTTTSASSSPTCSALLHMIEKRFFFGHAR
ncbi:MAG: hypothetical protein M0Z99_01240 [Betaproteobacteria bacterium]|nr:hypothetical protein [Betaproteobacteria bacterium]